MRVVVVGAGIVGLSTAYSLQNLGADVVVADAGSTGRPASWGNAGWLVPSLSAPIPDAGMLRYVLRSLGSPSSPVLLRPHLEGGLLSWMAQFARSCNASTHARGLAAMALFSAAAHQSFDDLAAAGVTFRMWRHGLRFVGLRREAAERQLSAMRPFEAYGYRLPAHVSGPDELRAQEPALGESIGGGFLVDQERHVDPGSLLQGLRDALLRSGGTIRDQCPVTALAPEGMGVLTAAGRLEADAVVVAAGAWSGQLLPGLRMPMTGGKGYSFSAQLAAPPARPLYLIEAKTGLTPLDGHVRLAGTMELAGLRDHADTRRLHAMRTSAARYVPGIAHSSIAQPWAGLRPMAPDGLPYIGAVPGTGRVHVATGHGMLGVTLGPLTGELLARSVLGEPLADVLAPFDPGRFAGRRQRRVPADRLALSHSAPTRS